jgi:hypothetical protein
MTQQERVLAGCLVGVIAVGGGYTLIKSKVYAPRVALKKEIVRESERRDALETRLASAPKRISAWQECTAQTLDTDATVAHALFREDVEGLLKRNGLTEGLAINPPPARLDKKGAREGFVELPLSVNVKGRLGELVNFLRDFYQQPYLVRVDKLHLRAELGRSSKGKKGSGGSAEPKLNITMTLSTLVLPKLKGVEHPTIDLAAVNDPEHEVVLASAARLGQEDPLAYNEITQKNIFKIYEPPPPPPPPPPRETVVTKPVERLPPVDPRRDADKFVLSGVGQLVEGPVAYVINTDQPANAPVTHQLNDNIDDGKLVLVVPEGIVVRVAPKGGQRQPSKNYFYPLGSNFKEREEVNPADHPEVARMLQLVLKQ